MLAGLTQVPPERASCIISHMIAEVEPPCPCNTDRITLIGRDANGAAVKIIVIGGEVWIDADGTALAAIERRICTKDVCGYERNSKG